MPNCRSHTWQDIRERIKRNIKNGVWLPGQLIPGEVVLAEQFGCSRSTVNRALRELAVTGVIDRKRKAGTRVAMQKARRVTAEIQVIRSQVESQQQDYHFKLLSRKTAIPLVSVREEMNIARGKKALHVRAVHYANNQPFIYEDRWVNTVTLPEIAKIDLERISVNEWLVENIPFTSGDFVVEAIEANKTVVKALSLNRHRTVLKSRRLTWLENRSVTRVNLYYAPGFKMRFEI